MRRSYFMVISKSSSSITCTSITVIRPGLVLDALLGFNLLGAHASLLTIPSVQIIAHDAFTFNLLFINFLGTYAVSFLSGA